MIETALESSLTMVLEKPCARGSSLASCLVKDKSCDQLYYAKSNIGASLEHSYREALKEKIALSLYSYFGMAVPDSRIALLPIHYSYDSYSNELFGFEQSRKTSYYLCTQYIEAEPLSKNSLLDDSQAAEVLAVGYLLNDVDVFGGSFKNVLYAVNQSGHKQLYKIDAGECFYSKEGSEAFAHVRYATQGSDIYIDVNRLPNHMKNAFYDTLGRVLNLKSEDIVSHLFSGLETSDLTVNRTMIADIISFLFQRMSRLKQHYSNYTRDPS